jgi:dipeptidyl aminopeptidase/acylaminoacyl peptidase
LAAWLLALAVTVEPSQAAFPGHNGRIAFQSFRDGNYEIYTMNPDGTVQTNVSNNSADDDFPAWSPDGTKIAFSSNRDGNSDIYVMNSDGSDPINISNSGLGVVDRMAAWSPDGTKIVFQRFQGPGEIYTMNADGTNQTNISNNPADDAFPAWSPDGTKIAFMSFRDGDWDIYTMNPDGTNLTNISNNSVHDEDPNWSPDGTKIAFWREDDHNVYVMDADGSNVTRLSTELGTEPAWSPDGTKIAFTYGSDINTMNADGSAQTPLTNDGQGNQFSDWGSAPIIVPPDTTPPEVSSTVPTNNATGVSTSAPITATFSEDVDVPSGNSWFTVKSVRTGTLVSGQLSYDATTKTATFRGTLNRGDGFKATITTEVKDKAGNALAQPYTWQFTTAGPKPKP